MKQIGTFLWLLGLVLISACSLKNKPVERYIKNPHVTLIDVREVEELQNNGQIEQAIHIPKGEALDRLGEIKTMSKPLVIFCHSGYRAQEIVDSLKEKGIKKVYNGGGMKDVKAILKK